MYFNFKAEAHNDMAITIKRVISFLWDLLQPYFGQGSKHVCLSFYLRGVKS